MQRNFMFLSLASVVLFGGFSHGAVCLAQAEPASGVEIVQAPGVPPPPPAPPDFNNGLKAMDEGRWSDALGSFDKVEAAHGEYADAALYWKAYNLEKLGRRDEARAACGLLASSAAQSPWNAECMALQVQSGVNNGKVQIATDHHGNMRVSADQMKINADAEREQGRVEREEYRVTTEAYSTGLYKGRDTPHDPNDDLKLLALNSLMQQEPEKAMPILRSFIFSDKPIELRRRALFVLATNKAPGSQDLLLEIATTSKDASLQRSAVQTLAETRGKAAEPVLVKIYQGSTDMQVKRAAVSGLFIAQDAPDLVTLARAEKDIEMKRNLVSQLALMHDPAATAYMEELLK
jgi:hypothetical protein